MAVNGWVVGIDAVRDRLSDAVARRFAGFERRARRLNACVKALNGCKGRLQRGKWPLNGWKGQLQGCTGRLNGCKGG